MSATFGSVKVERRVVYVNGDNVACETLDLALDREANRVLEAIIRLVVGDEPTEQYVVNLATDVHNDAPRLVEIIRAGIKVNGL